MKRLKFTILFLSIITAGCTHYYYVANIQNVPLFREKNELHLSGSLGSGENSFSTEVQAAYSFPSNIGIMTNFMTARGGTHETDRNWARGNYIEAAVGYYKPVQEYFVFEIFGGYGGGSQKHNYVNSSFDIYSFTTTRHHSGTSELSSNKLFIQPSAGMTFKAFDIAFSTRINRLNFNRTINRIDPQLNKYEHDIVDAIDQKRTYIFLEPALTLRAGWENIKFQLQAGFSGNSNDPEVQFENYHITLGLAFTLAERYKKKNSPKKSF